MQVIVQYKRSDSLRAPDHSNATLQLIGPVLEGYRQLETDADRVLTKSAGSPAEIKARTLGCAWVNRQKA